ncbi:SWIM zinc finger family protein [Candidatus Woesearchaeota archaeon]|nr:SWIM zinc finger family protein [Candidatus Woesearchaeota archaeon]
MFTGEILPRDYGIVVRRRRRAIFLSPTKFALGLALLGSPDDLERRIQNYSNDAHQSFRTVKKVFMDSADGRAPNIFSGGRAIESVALYGAMYDAFVRSQKNKSPHHVTMTVIDDNHLGHYDASCDCGDYIYGQSNGFSIICAHISALALALDIDNRSGKSSSENLTGLLPSDRKKIPRIPFMYYSRNSDLGMTKILWDLFVGKKSQYTINKSLLSERPVHASWVYEAVRDFYDRARYEVLRQEEKEASYDRFSASVRTLVENLCESLQEQGYIPQRYVLDFKGTTYESVARRFRKGNIVYDVVSSRKLLPLIVRKILHYKSVEVWRGDDSVGEHPYSRRDEDRINVDDSTRRICDEHIIIPSMHEKLSKLVSHEVGREYEKVLREQQRD